MAHSCNYSAPKLETFVLIVLILQVQISHFAKICCQRLERIGAQGRKQPKKPSIEEIEQAKVCNRLDLPT
jgi:MyTH4 domain